VLLRPLLLLLPLFWASQLFFGVITFQLSCYQLFFLLLVSRPLRIRKNLFSQFLVFQRIFILFHCDQRVGTILSRRNTIFCIIHQELKRKEQQGYYRRQYLQLSTNVQQDRCYFLNRYQEV
jgi:hypothetical protein